MVISITRASPAITRKISFNPTAVEGNRRPEASKTYCWWSITGLLLRPRGLN